MFLKGEKFESRKYQFCSSFFVFFSHIQSRILGLMQMLYTQKNYCTNGVLSSSLELHAIILWYQTHLRDSFLCSILCLFQVYMYTCGQTLWLPEINRFIHLYHAHIPISMYVIWNEVDIKSLEYSRVRSQKVVIEVGLGFQYSSCTQLLSRGAFLYKAWITLRQISNVHRVNNE